MKHININKNADLYILPSDKFKTFTISFHFLTKLSKETVSKNALFPFLVKLGSKNYPDMISINRKLEDLYGGYFDCSVRKKGDIHEIDFSFEFLSEKYSDKAQFNNCLNFIKQVLFNPLIENNGFKAEFVAREKENLQDYINSIINDKKEYTAVRLIEEMFKGDDYSLFEYGDIADFDSLSPVDLYNHYLDTINKASLIIFISGDCDEDKFKNTFSELINHERNDYPINVIYNKSLENPNIIEENQNITQGKFALGFKTDIKPEDEDYFALTLFNSIFGSGPHSKLFLNVREKLSLCYFVYSRLDRFKGIMTVTIGTDKENFKKAYDEIILQLNNCKSGNIKEDEIEFAKKYIISILKQAGDNQHSQKEFYLTGILANKIILEEEYIEKINSLKLEDIIRVANKITLQTEYYLS
jgi:predicted Zn-dependent peptidase